jgi:hypothetical protein
MGCSWPVGAEHPHRLVINHAVNDNPHARPSLRSEWRQKLGLKSAFVTSQGFIGGVAVHQQHPLVAMVGFDNDLLFYNRVSGNILWREKLKSSGVGSPHFDGDILYIPTGDGLLSAYHIKERKFLWKC